MVTLGPALRAPLLQREPQAHWALCPSTPEKDLKVPPEPVPISCCPEATEALLFFLLQVCDICRLCWGQRHLHGAGPLPSRVPPGSL